MPNDEKDNPMVADNPNTLPYPSNVGAPVIQPDDISTWKATRAVKTNHYFETEFEAIQKRFEQLVESYETNVMVYQAEFNFEPVIGESYHLYERDNGSKFLSLIPPSEWSDGPTYIGSYKMDADNRWVEND